MSETLDALLFVIRQHPGFKEFLTAVAPPEMPRYRPSKGGDLETLGAAMAYASGGKDQHDRWLELLTKSSQAKE